MGIDVVGAGLGIVFEDEEGGGVPEGRVGDGVDGAAYGKVVVGDGGVGRGPAGSSAGGVVVGQAEQDEFGHGVAAVFKIVEPALEVAEEDFNANLVGDSQLEVGRLGGEVAHEFGLGGDVGGDERNGPGPLV